MHNLTQQRVPKGGQVSHVAFRSNIVFVDVVFEIWVGAGHDGQCIGSCLCRLPIASSVDRRSFVSREDPGQALEATDNRTENVECLRFDAVDFMAALVETGAVRFDLGRLLA